MFTSVTRSGLASLLLSASCLLPAVPAAVLEMPIWFKNSYAIVETEIGTPGQKHFLLFDTGSATTWLMDETCADSTCYNYSGFPRSGYSANASSTSSSLGTYTSIDYLGGATAGFGLADVFSLPSAPNVIWEQTFLAANASSWFWIPCDGFLGLAFTTIADANTSTFVETLMQQGKVDEPRFGIYFGKEFNDTGSVAGEGVLTIGGSEEEKYVDGDLTWISPLQRLGAEGEYQLWRSDMVSMHGLELGSNGSVVNDKANYFAGDWAVFDTGAGGITVPPSQIYAMYESFGMNWTAILNGDHIPLCTEFNSSWAVSFQFGSSDAPATITMTGDQLARSGFAYEERYCFPPFDIGDVDGLFLFGASFLHQFYSVFDFGAFEVDAYEPRIGLGQLKEEWRPSV
ncbi:pepsinogen c [Pseudomassariella vexata]|uniref:Pepsinogen c n=1 Tax=Pseudomassariella vexata TaxID=1141098 RepID=A0A1Y2EJ41_9PEZI|nr:pepsinogen c [Pseudomassariella vexata]ORY71477.1 pepsinogen c [Pseudomassariella vexata]